MPPHRSSEPDGRPKPSAVLTALLGHPPIAFYSVLGPVAGGATPALLLSHLAYLSLSRGDPEGWVDQPEAEITRLTCLSRREQRTSRRRLLERSLIEVQRKRDFQGTRRYRVDFAKIEAALGQCVRNEQLPNVYETRALDRAKRTHCTSHKKEIPAPAAAHASVRAKTLLLPLVVSSYKETFGTRITRAIRTDLAAITDRPGITEADITYAFGEAARNGGRGLAYVVAILDRKSTPDRVAAAVIPHDEKNAACPCPQCQGARIYGGGNAD